MLSHFEFQSRYRKVSASLPWIPSAHQTSMHSSGFSDSFLPSPFVPETVQPTRTTAIAAAADTSNCEGSEGNWSKDSSEGILWIRMNFSAGEVLYTDVETLGCVSVGSLLVNKDKKQGRVTWRTW